MLTTVGKVFVILITTGSLIILGVSTVVLTTATDWRAEIKKQGEIETRLKGQLTPAQAAEAEAKGRYEIAKKEHVGATRPIEARIATLQGDIKKAQDDTAKAREELAQQQSAAKSALETSKARTEDIVKLREQKAAVETQRGKFEVRQSELENEIVGIKRMVQAAEINASQLGQSR